MTYISRHLSTNDKGLGENVPDCRLRQLPRPLVILGEPGSGKTTLTEQFAIASDTCRFTAAEMLSKEKSDLIGVERIVIDGLDEVVTTDFSSTLAKILNKISTNSMLVLTCRAADWQQAKGYAQIKGRWGYTPIVATLLPLNEQEIFELTKTLLEKLDAEKFIKKSHESDAYGLLSNPQTLLMLVEIWQSGDWPDSKAELFCRCCDRLVNEMNEFHQENNRESFSNDDLLDASGFIFAQILLARDASTELNNINELSSDAYPATLIKAAHSTKCFDISADGKITPHHRSIAEYLAAKWLTKQLKNKKISIRRLEEILYAKDFIVLSALRSVHVWLACMGSDCNEFITRDPYGVFIYSDTGMLTDNKARLLLRGLEEVANADPYFSRNNRFSAFGNSLARLELKEDIIEVITSSRQDFLLELIISSLAGSDIIAEIAEELQKILFDPEKVYIVRRAAFLSLVSSSDKADIVSLFNKLYQMDDEDSLQIATEQCRSHVELFDGDFIGKLLFKHSAVGHGSSGSRIVGIGWGLEKKMSTTQLQVALTYFATAERDLLENRNAQEAADEWGMKILNELGNRDEWPSAATIWSLLTQINPHNTYRISQQGEKIFFEKLLNELRQEIQCHALRQVTGDNGYVKTIIRLNRFGLSLHDGDVVNLFNKLMSDKESLDDWRDCLRVFVQFYTNIEGLIESARASAEGDNELLKFITNVTTPQEPPEWQRQEAALVAEREAQWAEEDKQHHANYNAIKENLENGTHLQAADQIAHAYLGQISLKADAPEERVRELVGDDMFDTAIGCISATLEAADVPSARDVAELAAKEKKYFRLEFIALAHCAMVLKKNDNLDSLDDDFILTALAACHWELGFGDYKIVDSIKKALRQRIYGNTALKERYVRDTIEPYFENDTTDDAPGLYQLANEPVFEDIAGVLAIEWLGKYKNIPDVALKEICKMAARYANSDDFIPIIRDQTAEAEQLAHPVASVWMNYALILDFNNHKEKLESYVKGKKDKIWDFVPSFTDETHYPGIGSAEALYFLISNFAPEWPNVSPPKNGWSGEQNPWDASRKIRDWIKQLAANLFDEAAGFMERLSQRQDIPDYIDLVKHLKVEQNKNRAEQNKMDNTIEQVRSILLAGPPESASDLQALLVDTLDDAEKRIRGSDTQQLQVFWDKDTPRYENYCRDRLVDVLRREVSGFNIDVSVEVASVQRRRVDIEAKIGNHIVPIEVKGQWHKDLWGAANTQLQDYTEKYGADGHGIYLVFWFGEMVTSERKLKKIIDMPTPTTSTGLKEQLEQHYVGLSSKTKIMVIDLSR